MLTRIHRISGVGAPCSSPIRQKCQAVGVGRETRVGRVMARVKRFGVFAVLVSFAVIMSGGVSLVAAGNSATGDPTVVRMRATNGQNVRSVASLDKLCLGNDPAQWRPGVSDFGRIESRNVFSGVDSVYPGNEGQIEYFFDLAPHADAAKIGLAPEGASALHLDADGNLLVRINGTDLLFRRPAAYQKTMYAERQFAPVNFVLKGRNETAVRERSGAA